MSMAARRFKTGADQRPVARHALRLQSLSPGKQIVAVDIVEGYGPGQA